jgi:hypothetical protein
MRSRILIVVEHYEARKVAAGKGWMEQLAATGDGRYQQNTIPFLQDAGFAAEEAYVFFVEVDVQELADLALVVADVPRKIRVARGELVQSFGNRAGTTVYFWSAVREAAKGCWDFDGD